MKALSVKQPWASRIAQKVKTIETRTWKTNYRGKLLIVASKNPPMPFAGHALCTVNLVDCRPMRPEDKDKAMCEYWPSLYAWIFEDIQSIIPFRVKGRLGFYEVEVKK